ncbi:MAG: hypothetical protein E7B29_15270 [Mixta calida]|nr:hypothetical protein [Mixta calida]KAF0859829.1 hypothetical protein Y888_09235 [Mixta calida B021323]MDU3077633.1 hypothetical protein [Mixta calida]
MFRKIIFLESEEFYKDLIDPFFFNSIDMSFDGGGFYKDIAHLKNYDLVIYTIYSSPLFNKIILNCKKDGIPTMLLMDGICEFSNFTKNKNITKLGFDNYHPVISDYLCVIGRRASNYFNVQGVKTCKYLPPRVLKNTYIENFSDEECGMNYFLITTANTAYYDDDEFERLCVVLKKTIDALEQKKENYCFRIFDEKIIKTLCIDESKNFTSGSFEEILNKVSFVITTPSSIMLQAMHSRKPVATLLYRDSPIFIQSGWIIYDGVNLQHVIDSMLLRDKKRMFFQQSELENTREYNSLNFTGETTEKICNQSDDFLKFVNQNLVNMLNSKFNFNAEFRFRKVYWKLKKTKVFKIIRKKIMG